MLKRLRLTKDRASNSLTTPMCRQDLLCVMHYSLEVLTNEQCLCHGALTLSLRSLTLVNTLGNLTLLVFPTTPIPNSTSAWIGRSVKAKEALSKSTLKKAVMRYWEQLLLGDLQVSLCAC